MKKRFDYLLRVTALIMIVMLSVQYISVVQADTSYRDPFEGFDAASFDDSKVVVGTLNSVPGDTHGIMNYSWLLYKDVNFYSQPANVIVETAVMAPHNGRMEVRLDAPDGLVIADFINEATSSYSRFNPNKIVINEEISGVHDVYLVFIANAHVRNIYFEQVPAGKKEVPVYKQRELNDITDNETYDLADMMISLGIIDIEDKKVFGEYDDFTVAEAYKAAAYLRNINVSEAAGAIYDDYTVDKKAAAAAVMLIDLGIIKKPEHNRLGLADPISANEFADILSGVLGYGSNMSGNVKSILLRGNFGSINDTINRKNACKMIENALEAPYLKIEQMGNTLGYTVTKESSILTEYNDIYKSKGIVTANDFTPLSSSANSVDEGNVSIDNEDYIAQYSNIHSLLGQRVEFYYKYDSITDKRILLYAKPIRNNVVTLLSDSIERIEENNIVYYDGKKERNIKYSGNTYIIYNYKAIEEIKTLAELIGNTEDFSGEITWIDNDNDNLADVISVIKYDIMCVKNYSEYDGIIYDLYGKEARLELNNEASRFSCIYDDGTLCDATSLKANDIISVAESINKNGWTYTLIKVSKTEADGYISRMNLQEREIVIGDTVYKIAPEYVKAINEKKVICPKPGNNVITKLDIFGRVAYIELKSNGKLGFVVRYSATAEDDTEEVPQIKLFNENGEMLTLAFAQKVRCDDTVYKSFEALIDYLNKASIKATLIYYKTNTNNEISYIDTVNKQEKTGKEVFTKITDTRTRVLVSASYGIGNKCSFIGDKVFVVPHPELEQYYDDELYSIKEKTAVASSWRVCDAYSTQGSKWFADVLVVFDPDSAPLSKIFLVEKVYETLLKDDEATVACEGYLNGTAQTVLFGKDSAYTQQISDTVKPGMILQPLFDMEGNFIDNSASIIGGSPMAVLADEKGNAKGSSVNAVDTYGNLTTRNIVGEILGVDNNFMAVKLADTGKETDGQENVFYIGGATVLLYDDGNSKNAVTQGDIGDLCENEKVFVNMSSSNANVIVVYK